uniref:Rugosin A-like peptide n=1 Tax=Pelophylax saharicus TaxID=70019 RepID=RUGA_PELSA|nr:RecName: Full=Rugosin A-like peptide [Pelophylax saharicus]
KGAAKGLLEVASCKLSKSC